jgi:hypothetical protein
MNFDISVGIKRRNLIGKENIIQYEKPCTDVLKVREIISIPVLNIKQQLDKTFEETLFNLERKNRKFFNNYVSYHHRTV